MVHITFPRYKERGPNEETEEDAMRIDTVLVPLDGSPLAEMALPTAVVLLRDSPDATLILLRAAEATTLPGIDPTEAQVAVVRDAENYLERVAARLRDDGLSRVLTSVWYGKPARAIVEAAQLRRADLIVMSTHGRSGLRRFVLGSVAESVLRGTRTPILLVSEAGARVKVRETQAASSIVMEDSTLKRVRSRGRTRVARR
jgi:nucleotide-binding universal stress UspA family protein